MRVEDLRALPIFEGLSDQQLAQLIERGSEVRIEPGLVLFREGEHADFWWVLVDGSVDLMRRAGREEILIRRMETPGHWAGGFRAWDEQGTYLATGLGSAGGRMLQVPAEALGELANEWFPLGVHFIRGVYATARVIESTARQRESLATLGRLAAGLAHEINNPAAAAVRSVDALETAAQTLLASVAGLAHGEVSPQQLTALDQLRRELDPGAGSLADPLVLADQEEAISSWLARRGIQHEWTIAPPLAAAGGDVAWCDQAATVLEGQALEAGIEWVTSTLSVDTLLAEIKEATHRISDLVGAVKSYTQMDRASMQQIDVTEGIESTLVMLGQRLRGGVTVTRDYAATAPRVYAHAGELNQVWTNLIDNAIDAMEGQGDLQVATRTDGAYVVVEIGDSGPGMPPEVAARAFEAFYTTKGVGRGTGLGLDIARRIVEERHGGSIGIDSRPGRTVLRVRLPVQAGGGTTPGS